MVFKDPNRDSTPFYVWAGGGVVFECVLFTRNAILLEQRMSRMCVWGGGETEELNFIFG